MSACDLTTDTCGWVPGPSRRGTLSIIWACLATVWLCTWTSLCLNVPQQKDTRGWRFLVYKFKWQLFAIFFPEVLVAMTAEQWLSAKQSVRRFSEMGHPEWTIYHGFYADMGGIMVAPQGSDIFPVDSYQLAYLVKHGIMPMPSIDVEAIRAVNKADGLARLVTLIQMAWFAITCLGRAGQSLSLSPLELETLCFILCTLHTFFFWYYKPLDPARGIIIPIDKSIDEICSPENKGSYERTPFDFMKPPPDSKSLVMPFWFGMKSLFIWRGKTPPKPRKTIANTGGTPSDGLGWPLTMYIELFQYAYYGLHIGVAWRIKNNFPTHAEYLIWEISNATDIGLIAIYSVGVGVGTYLTPWFANFLFHRKATRVLEVAAMLPRWAQLLIHGPFILGYLFGRALVLTEALIAMRALPPILYLDVDWASFIPHF